MKTVLIIGAGATRAEADSQGAKRNQRPPLDGDFFELSEIHAADTHRATVEKYVRENFSLDIFTHPRPRMEEVFGLVYASTLVQPIPTGAKAAFSSLCRIYSKVIADTTNWIEPRRRGALCRLIHHCKAAGPTTIITFNQDIVIEKALSVLTDATGDSAWYPDSGYGLDFSAFTTPSGSSSAALFPLSADPSDNTVDILKPHGSLNWYAKTLRNDRVLSQLRSGQKVHCTRRRHLHTEMTYTQNTTSGKGRQTWHTWPIIVPPILEKGTFLTGALADIWSLSWKRLRAADRIVVYGYSFPDADAQSRSFFIRAAAKRKSRVDLVSINPDVTAAERAHAIFHPERHLMVERSRAFLNW